MKELLQECFDLMDKFDEYCYITLFSDCTGSLYSSEDKKVFTFLGLGQLKEKLTLLLEN